MRLEIQWKPIDGFPNYLISNDGQVFSFRKNGNIYQRFIRGYQAVRLQNRKVSKNFLVHRLVAVAFVPNPQNKPQVNHKNGLRDDPRAENLEWCTPSENIQHAYDALGRKRNQSLKWRFGSQHPTSKSIVAISSDGTFHNFESTYDAVRCGAGLFATSITRACKEKIKTHNGFAWCYA